MEEFLYDDKIQGECDEKEGAMIINKKQHDGIC